MPTITHPARALSNIDRRLSDNTPPRTRLILNNISGLRRFGVMKHTLSIVAIALALSATSANAACVAEYKAKRDKPLRLDYGTVTVPGNDCTALAVQAAVSAELASRGWTLLSILSVRQSG